MDIFDTMGVVLRRWRITVPVALLGLMATLWVANGVGTEFESRGTVVLVPATVNYNTIGESTEEEIVNPYLNAGVTRTLATAVRIAVGSSTMRRQALEAGLSSRYEIELDNVEPILFVSAKAPTPELSSETLDFVFWELRRELDERQAIDPDGDNRDSATMELLSEVRAIPDSSASIKMLGSFLVVVALATVMAGVAVEGLAQRRLVRFAAAA